jgi:hypothetical protein
MIRYHMASNSLRTCVDIEEYKLSDGGGGGEMKAYTCHERKPTLCVNCVRPT